MLDVIKDTLIDGIKLLPFLFITYLIMEYLEHKTGDKSKNIVKKSGKFGPLLGGFLGVFPQCGFSAAAANLYSGRVITIGTLIAVFLSTSDEMLPILISEEAPISLMLQILAIKLIIAVIAGFLIDFVHKLILKKNKEKIEEDTEEAIEQMCEDAHCDCEHDGILKSSIKHTLNIFGFILLITFAINALIYFIGEDRLSSIILNVPIVGTLISGIIGLIPNCAGSVIITELYLSHLISFGTMIAGLLVGSGIGILVLFKSNKHIKENLKIVGILYTIGIICGIIIDLFLHT
jgi:hypothetical protein